MPRPQSESLASRARYVIAALAVVATFAVALPAGANDPESRLEAARAAIDEIADDYFDLATEINALDVRIAVLEQQLAAARARSAVARETATERALEIYKSSGTPLEHVIADDAIDAARRVELIDRANAEGTAAFDLLRAAVDEIEQRREALEDRRARRTRALELLGERRSALEGEVAAARAAYLDTLGDETPRAATAGVSAASAASRPAAERTDAGTPAPVAVTGTHDHHDDPFLVCTRQRESNGDYTAVNGAGYYGAYQFARTTWDATATHGGRPELIGVRPDLASAFDQDDMAWTLFTWQGKQPWGNRC